MQLGYITVHEHGRDGLCSYEKRGMDTTHAPANRRISRRVTRATHIEK